MTRRIELEFPENPDQKSPQPWVRPYRGALRAGLSCWALSMVTSATVTFHFLGLEAAFAVLFSCFGVGLLGYGAGVQMVIVLMAERGFAIDMKQGLGIISIHYGQVYRWYDKGHNLEVDLDDRSGPHVPL